MSFECNIIEHYQTLIRCLSLSEGNKNPPPIVKGGFNSVERLKSVQCLPITIVYNNNYEVKSRMKIQPIERIYKTIDRKPKKCYTKPKKKHKVGTKGALVDIKA